MVKKNPDPEKVAERFWAKVEKADGDACWIWHGARSSASGYATFRYYGHNINGHRAAWLLTYGPIEGKDVDVLHRCNNGHRGCVRPDHLYLGSHRDNMQDKIAAGRSLRGHNNPRAKLTREQAIALKRAYRWIGPRKTNVDELARQYGISSTAAYALATGRTWKNLP